MSQFEPNDLGDFILGYTRNVRTGFDQRWSSIVPRIYDKYVHESIGGILSRQATLTIELAQAPSTWNGHVAPLFLRSMVDAYITLAWILEKPNERSEQYVKYGLGQEKLQIEYMEKRIAEDPKSFHSREYREMIKMRRSWLNSQLAEWFTEINVGSWSGVSTRQMAKDIGRESIYQFAYVPFSSSVHNMWNHVAAYNLRQCRNPLHKWHLVPTIMALDIDLDFMFRSAKYISISYQLFDETMDVTCDTELPQSFLLNHKLFRIGEQDGE